MSECGSNLVGECPAGRMHLWADRYLPEILDPLTGTLTAEGTGQLVVTTLYREAMPLVRYNIGDLVELRYPECPCGWHLPLFRVFGRQPSMAGPEARPLSVTDVEDIVYSLPEQLGVLFWQGVISASGLRIEIEAEASCAAEAASELCTRTTAQLGMPADVTVVPPGTLVPLDVLTQGEPHGKPRSLIHRRGGSRQRHPLPITARAVTGRPPLRQQRPVGLVAVSARDPRHGQDRSRHTRRLELARIPVSSRVQGLPYPHWLEK